MDNLSIVVPYFNGSETIRRLLDSLPSSLPVIVVDDQSDMRLPPGKFGPGTVVIRPEQKGYFTGAVNRGIEACNTDVLILNQDAYFTGDGWLKLLAENRTDYDLIGEGISGNHPAWPRGYIHGTFMYISRRVIDTIGLMNEVDYPLWGSTCEYQLRACRAGFRALPLSTIYDFHHRDDKRQQFGDAINTALEREPSRRREFIRTPPEISVIIPCYNYGRYLAEAVGSLMTQTFQSFEVVIVDDASTDNSAEIAQSLVDPWKGIRLIRLAKNTGTAGAINAGIEASYGRYISVLSADDMMKPKRLDNLYRLQLQNPHSFIFDDLVVFGSSKLGGTKQVGEERIFECPPYDFEQLLKKNGVHAGIFYPKAAWEDAGGYPVSMGRGREDWAFNVALGLKGWCGVKCDTPGYLYRREGQNRTMVNTSPEHRQRFFGQMLALYPDIYRGYRPMGCCGSKGAIRNAPTNGGGTVAMTSLPGKDGFEILEYIGTSASDMSWYGPETRTRYVFGGTRRVGYVDKKDVAKMVALVDQGAKVFRVYQKAEAPAPTNILSGISEGLQASSDELLAKTAEVVEAMVEQIAVSLPFDPANYSFRQLSKMVDELTAEQLSALALTEKAGKNRSSVIGLFADRVNV